MWIADGPELTAIVNSPLRAGLQAKAEGREVFVAGELAGAMSFSSPLSLPYTVEHLVPDLVAAVDGDPATVVPSATAATGTASSAPATTAGATTTTG